MRQPVCRQTFDVKKMNQIKKKMKGTLLPILMVIVVCLISSSSPVSTAQSPIQQNIIIQYGDSAEERKAISIIQEQTGAAILSADSFLLHLKIQRSKGMIFVVGHGNEEGILHKGDVKVWEDIAQGLRLSSESVILVSCNSREVAQEYNYFGGFPENVDAVVAAYVATAAYFMITKQHGRAQENIVRAKQRSQAILHDPSLTDSLGLSWEEGVFSFLFLLLDLISLIPALKSIPTLKRKVFEKLASSEIAQQRYLAKLVTKEAKHWSLLLSGINFFLTAVVVAKETFFSDNLGDFFNANLTIDDEDLTREKVRDIVNGLEEDLQDEGYIEDSTDSETEDSANIFPVIYFTVSTAFEMLGFWDKLFVLASLGLDILGIALPAGWLLTLVNVLSSAVAFVSLLSSIFTLIRDYEDEDDVYDFSVDENNGTKAGEDYGLEFAFKTGYKEGFTEKINASGIVDYYKFNSQFIEGLSPRPAEDCGGGEYCDLFGNGFNSKKSDRVQILSGNFWGDHQSALYLDGYRRGQDSGALLGKASIIKAGYFTGFFTEFRHVTVSGKDSIILEEDIYGDGYTYYLYDGDTYDAYIFEAFYFYGLKAFIDQPDYMSSLSEAYRLGFEHGFEHGFNTSFLKNTYYDLSVTIGKQSDNPVLQNSSSEESIMPDSLREPDNPSYSLSSLMKLPYNDALFTGEYSPFTSSDPIYISSFISSYFRAQNYYAHPVIDTVYKLGYDKGYAEDLPSDLLGKDAMIVRIAFSGMFDGQEYFFNKSYEREYLQAYENGYVDGSNDGQNSLAHKRYREYFNTGRDEGNLDGAYAGNETGFWIGYFQAHLDLDVDFPSYFGFPSRSEGYEEGYAPDLPDLEYIDFARISSYSPQKQFNSLQDYFIIRNYKLGYESGYSSSFSSSYDSGNASGFETPLQDVSSTVAGKLGANSGSSNVKFAAYQRSYIYGFLLSYKADYFSSSSLSLRDIESNISAYFSLRGVGLELYPLNELVASYTFSTLSKLHFAVAYLDSYSSAYDSLGYSDPSLAIGKASYDLLSSFQRSAIYLKYGSSAFSSIFQVSSVSKKVAALFDYSVLDSQYPDYVFAFLDAYSYGVAALDSLGLVNISGHEVGYDQGYFDGSPASWGLSNMIFHNTTKYNNQYQTLYNTFYDDNYSRSSSTVNLNHEDSFFSNLATSGSVAGYDFGFANRYRELYSKAYARGYYIGKSASSAGNPHKDYLYAYQAGYTEGYSDGSTAGDAVGYDRGYYFGYMSTDAPPGVVSTPLSYDAGSAKSYDPDPNPPNYNDVNLAEGSDFEAFKRADKELYIANYNLGYNRQYSTGYASGHYSGYDRGWSHGVAYGSSVANSMTFSYNQGYNLGSSKGESLGYNSGYTAGLRAAAGLGYVSSASSYNDSKEEGYSYTSPSSYDSYADLTYLRNHKAQYDQGYSDGFAAKYTENYDAGYSAGYAVNSNRGSGSDIL